MRLRDYYKTFRRGPARTLPEQEIPFSPISSKRVTCIHIHTYKSRVPDHFIHSSRDTYRKINTADA